MTESFRDSYTSFGNFTSRASIVYTALRFIFLAPTTDCEALTSQCLFQPRVQIAHFSRTYMVRSVKTIFPAPGTDLCLRVSICCDKHYCRKQSEGEGVDLSSQLLSHTPSRRETKPGPGGRNEAEVTEGCHLLLACSYGLLGPLSFVSHYH